MRLLPQTPCGTWLLAGIVWAAGCWLLWWTLPVRPRAQWTDDGVKVMLGFTPARRAVVTHSVCAQDEQVMASINRGPLRFWEADTGLVTEWFDAAEELVWPTLSPDGRWIALHHGRGNSFRFELIETVMGNVRCDLPLQHAQSFPIRPCFSPDSRWLAYFEVPSGHDSCVRVWDVTAAREHGILKLADGLLPFAILVSFGFSPDGRTLAIGTMGRTKVAQQIQLWDLDTCRLIRTLSGPIAEGCEYLHFSADGSYLAATFVDQVPPQYPREVYSWEVRTGAEQFHQGGAIVSAEADRLWLTRGSVGSLSYAARGFTGSLEHMLTQVQ